MASETPAAVTVPPELPCAICTKTAGRYTCPRCNLLYCSAACYRDAAHRDCSELFYRDCCLESLEDASLPKEQRDLMLAALRREQEAVAYDEDENEEREEEADLADRVADIDLSADAFDENDLWQRLTLKERNEFEQIVNSGQWTQLVPEWTPWWSSVDQNKWPAVRLVPPLSEMFSGAPHAAVRFTLLGCIFLYSFLNRYLLGELRCAEALHLIVRSIPLRPALQWQSASQALTAVRTNIQQSDTVRDCETLLLCALQDTAQLFRTGRPAIAAALSDMGAVLRDKQLAFESRSTRALVNRKLDFLLAWHREGSGGLSPQQLQQLALLAEAELCQRSADFHAYLQLNAHVERAQLREQQCQRQTQQESLANDSCRAQPRSQLIEEL